MGSDANRLREKWQDYSVRNAGLAEMDFFRTFEALFKDSEYKIRSKPTELQKIYVDVELSEKELSEIYNPKEEITKHGVFPDFAIDNTETNKTIYIEVKRQDGWLKGKNVQRAGGMLTSVRPNISLPVCKRF
jgi:hypothetical protein